MKPAFLSVLFLLAASFLRAQTDTTIVFNEVEITAARFEKYDLSPKPEPSDSLYLRHFSSGNLADMATAQSSIFVKNYGISNLSTVSLRGTDASHTAVLWNGFNLLSPMNGVLDFSLIPLEIMDEARLVEGGATALSGGAALGGAVYLENKVKNRLGWSGYAGGGAGSFDDFRQFGAVHFSNSDFRTSLRVAHQTADNDFQLTKRRALRDLHQENARLEKLNILQDNQFRLSANQLLTTWFWYQNVERQIPPPLFVRNDHAVQKDENYRAAANWRIFQKNAVANVRAAFLDELLQFDSDVVDSAASRVRSFIAEGEQDFQLKNGQQLNIGAHYTAHFAAAEALDGNPERHRIAFFSAWKGRLYNGRWTALASLRSEWLSDLQQHALAGAAGMEYHFLKGAKIYAKLSRNYKAPTFNDLFWLGSGNRDLRPEIGWMEEAGLKWSKTAGKTRLSANVTTFSYQVEDWIQWLPTGSVWRPFNHKSVWSRGLESNLDYSLVYSNWLFHFRIHYAFTKSTVEKTGENGSIASIGRQLPYVPEHLGGLNLFFKYRGSFAGYHHQFTGSRFTTSDNSVSERLPLFHVGNFFAGQELTFGKIQAQLLLKINNLWNAEYQVVESRAMPLRHFYGEIHVRF